LENHFGFACPPSGDIPPRVLFETNGSACGGRLPSPAAMTVISSRAEPLVNAGYITLANRSDFDRLCQFSAFDISLLDPKPIQLFRFGLLRQPKALANF
jgi:hypothetical protein